MKRLLVLVPVALVACGSPSAGITPTAQQSSSGDELQRIDCQVAYNPARTGKSATLTVPVGQDGAQQHTDSVRFRQMAMRISYFDDGFETPAFNAVVKSTGAMEDISARLYQLERVSDEQGAPAKRPDNEFVGGHGFTGLAYEFDPDSRAEIQYWCEAF